MDAALIGAPVAPPARIRRDTASQRAFLPRVLETAEGLAHLASLQDEGAARACLERRLPALRAALAASPCYRRILATAALSPRDLRSLDDLVHFPTLSRDVLAEDWRALPVLHGEAAAGVVVVSSSGTTGAPAPVPRDRYDCLHMWAVLRFWLGWLGLALPPRPRVVLLCSLPGGLEYSVRLPLLGDGALHRISLARPRPLERLRRAAPAVVFSDPDGFHWLATRQEPPLPRLLLTSAQCFGGDQRSALAAAVPAPVVNYYATTETGPIAWECLAAPGRFHVLAPDVWVESVAGELVVTRLRPSVLPLLRYRTGDAGRVERDRCACGFRGWTVTGFAGRRACAFRLPGGGSVDAWRLAWVFKHHSLRAFRLTQVGPESFGLELAEPGDAPSLVARLTAALQVLGWREPAIEVRPWAAPESAPKPEPFRAAWGLGPRGRAAG